MSAIFSDNLDKIKGICSLRIPPNKQISQCHVTPETLQKRINFIGAHEEVSNTKILCIGDDDFTSIALGLSFKVKEIVVLDMDERILSQINRLANDWNIPITTICYDIRNIYSNLYPETLKSSFDIAITDPPPTQDGISLFLALGFYCLNEKGRFYAAIPYDISYSWTPGLLYNVENLFLTNGFMFSHIEPNFHDYEKVYNKTFPLSSMIRAQRTISKQLNISQLEGPDAFYPTHITEA
jgi:predicted methyltransferase